MFRKIMLFISSYIPLYILLIVKNILERVTYGGNFTFSFSKEYIFFDEINDYAIIVLLILCLISYLYLSVKIKHTRGEKYYKVISVQNETSNYYFNYISIYLLSCLGLTLNNIVDVFVLVFLMIIVGYIYISNKMTYINPTLNLMGYNVYNMTVESESTGKKIESIVIAKNNVCFKSGIRIRGTSKQDFIFADEIIQKEL
ncbi:hypothetical protein [Clostridium sp.]|uniref:hypothetical protein n=1 Tax=Clostridium sp. TaxID=1506 RepID=UPI001ED4FDE0|nr:hypothetical protein [Clostridium sp.]MBS5886682.1 hypothetical protein [Clostridium sp.]